MSHGRNTQVITVRLPDQVAQQVKAIAKRRKRTVSDLLAALITPWATNPRRLPRKPEEYVPPLSPSPVQHDLDPPKGTPRNHPCPCGKVKPDGTPVKYKHCHGSPVYTQGSFQ